MTTDPFTWLGRRSLKHTQRPTQSPLSIYVLWHPSFVEGPALAREVLHWFGGESPDARAQGVGIPVHFRSAEWTPVQAIHGQEFPADVTADGVDPVRTRRGAAVRRPLSLHHATHNIFIPLVDDHMVEDPSWRRDLVELARRHAECRDAPTGTTRTWVHLAPVQLTSAWPRMPECVTRIKALYLKRWDDNPTETSAARTTRWRLRLRRLVTQAVVRLLRDHAGCSMPTDVFLSHAKADLRLGPGVAERLRDVAAGYGQIEVFYDENDLPSGIEWKRRCCPPPATARASWRC